MEMMTEAGFTGIKSWYGSTIMPLKMVGGPFIERRSEMARVKKEFPGKYDAVLADI